MKSVVVVDASTYTKKIEECVREETVYLATLKSKST
jgi:hypothetical protein